MAETLNRGELLDIGEIFRSFGEDQGFERFRPDRDTRRTIHALSICRTAELGGHVDACSRCGETRISYNSCRNRHCPKCQHLKREKWILDRERDLLPVKYHHMVFTVPAQLNQLFQLNKRTLYEILFRSVSESILLLAAEKKYLGAKPGIIAILHTWGQNLMDHPHIHCIVTGGGMKEEKWIEKDTDFFLPVRVLSRIFRGKFLDKLKKLRAAGELTTPASATATDEFPDFLNDLYKKEWVVFCKEPFRTPDHLIQYLGRYTHRVAISNHRILDVDREHVTFSYKDYSQGAVRRVMKLSKAEFIRRFLLHILPAGFVKIRYYGMLANPVRQKLIAWARKDLKKRLRILSKSVPLLKTWQELLLYATGIDPDICPFCLTGKMAVILPIQARSRSP